MPLIQFKCYPKNLTKEQKESIAMKMVEAVRTEIDAPLEAYTVTCEEIQKEDWPDLVLPGLEKSPEIIVMDRGKFRT